jgi:hypothetical protein
VPVIEIIFLGGLMDNLEIKFFKEDKSTFLLS